MRLLSSTREALNAQYIEEPFIGGPSYRDLRERSDAAMVGVKLSPLVAAPVPFSHRGVTMPTVDAAADAEIQVEIKKYATGILADLDDRFPDVPLFTALQIFDFTAMPTESQWATCKGTWGDAELKQLIHHFGVPKVSAGPLGKTHSRVVDPTLARAQWGSFKHELYALKRRLGSVSRMDTSRFSGRTCSPTSSGSLAFFWRFACRRSGVNVASVSWHLSRPAFATA